MEVATKRDATGWIRIMNRHDSRWEMWKTDWRRCMALLSPCSVSCTKGGPLGWYGKLWVPQQVRPHNGLSNVMTQETSINSYWGRIKPLLLRRGFMKSWILHHFARVLWRLFRSYPFFCFSGAARSWSLAAHGRSPAPDLSLVAPTGGASADGRPKSSETWPVPGWGWGWSTRTVSTETWSGPQQHGVIIRQRVYHVPMYNLHQFAAWYWMRASSSIWVSFRVWKCRQTEH